MAEQKPTKKEYRLLAKNFTTRENGEVKLHAKGSIVPLTDTQYAAFKDQFEPKDAAAQKAKETALADEKHAVAKKDEAATAAAIMKGANAAKADAAGNAPDANKDDAEKAA